jgi:hypothetical protein
MLLSFVASAQARHEWTLVSVRVETTAGDQPEIYGPGGPGAKGSRDPIPQASVEIAFGGREHHALTNRAGVARFRVRREGDEDPMDLEVAHPHYLGIRLPGALMLPAQGAMPILVRLPPGSCTGSGCTGSCRSPPLLAFSRPR